MNSISLDEHLKLVANPVRRRLLCELRKRNNKQTTTVELVAVLRHDGRLEVNNRSFGREELAIQVHHVHLPKLADLGVIDFDPEQGSVKYYADNQLEKLLDSIQHDVPQPNA